jgi:hypothetical protein
MKKILCVVAVLLGAALALSFGSAHPSLTAPVIVASGQALHKTTQLPQVPMYTPTVDGVYRISAYATLTTRDASSNSYWAYNVGWTDAVGPEQNAWLLLAYGANNIGTFYPFWNPNEQAGTYPIVIQARAGRPITHLMSQSGPPDGSVYNLYWVVEQIQ